jgi:hypothetical protein
MERDLTFLDQQITSQIFYTFKAVPIKTSVSFSEEINKVEQVF